MRRCPAEVIDWDNPLAVVHLPDHGRWIFFGVSAEYSRLAALGPNLAFYFLHKAAQLVLELWLHLGLATHVDVHLLLVICHGEEIRAVLWRLLSVESLLPNYFVLHSRTSQFSDLGRFLNDALPTIWLFWF